MNTNKAKTTRRKRRHVQIRRRVQGTPEKPRMAVYRSLKHIYVQVIDDLSGRTLASACTREASVADTGNAKGAAAVGKLIADRAKEAGVSKVAFDRGGFRYHGRIKALADAAREGGLTF